MEFRKREGSKDHFLSFRDFRDLFWQDQSLGPPRNRLLYTYVTKYKNIQTLYSKVFVFYSVFARLSTREQIDVLICGKYICDIKNPKQSTVFLSSAGEKLAELELRLKSAKEVEYVPL